MELLTPSLPMSCSSAARFSQRRRSARQVQLLGDQVGEQRDALAVAAGVGALGVDHLGEGGGDVVEIVVVDQSSACCAGSSAKIASCRSRRARASPRMRVARRRARRPLDQLRIEPGAGAVRDFALRGLDAVRDWNTSTTCASSAMRDIRAGSRRRSSPSGCRRRSSARRGSGCRCATLSENRIWRAISAPRWQRVSISSLRDLAAVLEDVDHRAEALGQPGLHAGVRRARSAAPAAGCRRPS